MSAADTSRRLRRYTSLASALDLLVNERLALLSPHTWQDKNDTRFMEAYRKASGCERVFAACLTTSVETYHHWELFARRQEGICIEFNRQNLENVLGVDPRCRFDIVKYYAIPELQTKTFLPSADIPFMKRFGFRDEKEYRIVYTTDAEVDRHYIRLDHSCVKQIIVNPWLDASLYPVVRAAIQGANRAWRVKVSKSSLIDNSTWNEAVSRIDDFAKLLE